MPEIERLDDCLSIREDHLFIEECDAVELVHQFGSPIFVYSENQLRRNAREFQRTFQAGWPDGELKVLPAAKANWLLASQRILAEEGCGCDIYSSGELTMALKAGVDPADISVNGVPKDEDHILRSVREGARITIDSVEELEVIERAARELNVVAKVRLRLKPAISGFVQRTDFVAEGLVPTDIAALVYKGGLPKADVIRLGKRILGMENVELVGFHEHHGRHQRGLRYWEEQMKSFAEEVGEVCRALGGYQPQEIDIGGGFAIPRDPFNAVTDYSEPLLLGALYTLSKVLKPLGRKARYSVMTRLIDTIVTKPNQTPAPSIEAYAQVCTSTLKRELPRHGIEMRGLKLQIEPGRAMHGNTGVHLTKVTNIKQLSSPIRWNQIIIDTTEFWFTGGRYEHHLHDYLFANKAGAEMTGNADIIGRSCFGDRLFPTVPVPEVEVGDILAMLDTGAYQEVSMSNFNAMPRPATVLVTDDRASVVRRAETEEDVFRRDLLPEHLMGEAEGQQKEIPRRPDASEKPQTAWA